MTAKRVLSCLMAVILTVTLICPALGSTARAAYPSVTDKSGEFTAYHYLPGSENNAEQKTTSLDAILSQNGEPTASYDTPYLKIPFRLTLQSTQNYCYTADFRIEITDGKDSSYSRIFQIDKLYSTRYSFTPLIDVDDIGFPHTYTDITVKGISQGTDIYNNTFS